VRYVTPARHLERLLGGQVRLGVGHLVLRRQASCSR
jgi:hypothetical protein